MILVASCVERVAALGFGHFGSEVLDRVHAADEYVAQRLTARLRIVERLDRRRNRVRSGETATVCTTLMASSRPLAVDTTGPRSGFCSASHWASASS